MIIFSSEKPTARAAAETLISWPVAASSSRALSTRCRRRVLS